MKPPPNPMLWLVLAIAVLGAPASAAAQRDDPANFVDAPGLNAFQIREPELFQVREPALKIEAHAGLITSTDNHHDVAFHALSTAFLIAASTDLSVSMYQVGSGTAREVGFGAQWQDSPVAFAITKSAMAAAFAYGLQRIHKNRPKTAFILGVAATVIEGWLAVRGAGMSPSNP